MDQRGPDWCFHCPTCDLWASRLPVGINTDALHQALDEAHRENGLETLRRENLKAVATTLKRCGLAPGARVLDVGSAHGWFLSAANDAGFRAEGIEPDASIAERSERQPVKIGYFPDVLEEGERYDAIAFNDVLEHLPDVAAALKACVAHMTPDGLLSINIPTTDGLVFRTSVMLGRTGFAGLFERLWQVGLPSPHLWYFNQRNLTELAELHGLTVIHTGTLSSVRRRGLWNRAHLDRRPSITSVIGVGLLWLAAPLLNHRRANDIMHLVMRPAG